MNIIDRMIQVSHYGVAVVVWFRMAGRMNSALRRHEVVAADPGDLA